MKSIIVVHQILRELNIGVVTKFPIDYMHLICLGIVKKIINIWTNGPLHVRIGANTVSLISDGIMALQSYLPREFARKGRKLAEIERWKATEFRTFLLYTGPIVLRGKLSDILYKKCMMLFAGVTILCNINLYEQYCDYVERLFGSFVEHFEAWYGQEMIIYNVHVLIHLAEHSRRFEPLHDFSGFPFENYLHILKKLIRKPKFPLQQAIRRLTEKMHSTSALKIRGTFCKKEHRRGPLPDNIAHCTQYEQIHLPNVMLYTKKT